MKQYHPKTTVPCAVCGTDIQTYVSVMRKTCSSACLDVWNRRERPERRTLQPQACGTCGRIFRPRSRVRRFCSVPCKGAWLSIAWRGANSPVWNGGPKPRPDLYTAKWRDLRVRLFQEADYRCARCGEIRKRVVGHHIISVKARPDLALDEKNVQVLCIPCHRRVHTS